MVSSGVNIKVGIDVSQAKTGLEQLRQEFEALGSTRPKSNLTFLDTIKTSLNSIKNTMNQLKSAFTQGFSVIEKSADGTNTVLKSISVSLDKTSKSAEKATKSVETLGSSLTSAGMKSDKAFLTAEQKAAKFNAKIEKMIGTINRLNQDELRFAKTPFDMNDKFYAINHELMQTIGYLKKGEQGADLLRKAFTTLGDGDEINKIAGSLTQLEARVKDVNLVMNTLKASTVSLNQVGLGTKSLGDWGKVNSEMLQSDKTAQQLKNKLLSLDEVQFSNVFNSVQLLNFAIKNDLIPDLVKANEELNAMYRKKQTAQRVGLMNQNDLTTLNYLPRSIRAISEAYAHGKISTKEFVVQVQEAVNALNSTSYTRFVNSLNTYENRIERVNVQLERLQELARIGGVNNIAVANIGVKPIPEVKQIINDLMTGKKSLEYIRRELLELNNVKFDRISTNLDNINKDLVKGKENTEMFMNGWSQMAISAAEKFAVFPKTVSDGMRLIEQAVKGTNVALNQFNKSYESMLAKQYKANAGAGGISAYAQSGIGYKPTTPNVVDYTAINKANQSIKMQGTTAGNVAGIMSQYSKEIESATRKNDLIASASNRASKSVNNFGRAAGSAKRQVNALDKVSGMLRRTVSGLVVFFGWNLVTDLIEVGKNSADAANQIQMVGNSMHWSQGQVSSFTSTMRDLQSVYPKIDMSQTAKSVMEMARNYNLTNAEATKLIKTSAVFTSAMAKEGRTTEDANLALKDYLDGGSGWTRRMSEIGATRERLKGTGKWSGDENDINGKIAALDTLMQQKGYDEFAKNIYTLDDAFNAFKYTLGSVIGELAQGLTPTIIAMTKGVISAISWVKGLIQAFQGSSFGNQALQIIAVSAAFSGLAIVILRVVGTVVGLLKAKTLLLSLTNPIGIIIAAVSLLAVTVYEVGKAFGYWHDFNSMIMKIGDSLNTVNGKLVAIAGVITTLAVVGIARHFSDSGNIAVRAINKVIDSIKKYIEALAAKKVAEEADAATSAGKKGAEVAGDVAEAGAAGAAGKVASEGKKVSMVSKVFGALGIEYTADAGFVSMFNASGTALAGALGAAIPVIAVLTAVIGIVIAAIFGLAAECTLLLKGLQILINAMHFENINLQPAVNGLKQLSAALWEMLVAMTELSLISILHLITGDIIGVAYQLWALGSEIAKLKAAIPMINSFSSAQKISPKVVENLTSLSKSLVAMNNASKSLGSIGSEEGWKKFWEWLRVKMPDSEALSEVHKNLTDAIPKINSFADLPSVNDTAVQKIGKISDALGKLSSAMKSLDDLQKNSGGAMKYGTFDPRSIWRWLTGFVDYATMLTEIRTSLWTVARTLATFKDMPAIPNGVGTKLQRVTWTLTDVANAVNALNKIPPVADGDTNGLLGTWGDKIDNVKTVLWNVAGKVRTLHDMPAIPEGTGQKLQRVTWVLNDVKSALDSFKSVISGMGGNDDYSSKVSQLSTLTGSIHKIAVPLRNLSTIANIPDGVSNKLNRITWALNDAKGVRNSINSYGSVSVDANAVSNISKVTGATHQIAVPLRNLSTIANIPPTVSVKLAGVNRTLVSLKSTANNIRGANASMTGLPPYQVFSIRLGNLKKIIEKLRDFKVTGNTKGNNLSGISAMVKNISTQVNACVTAVNHAVSSLGSAGRRLGSALKNGVSAGVSGTGQLVVNQISIMNGAMDSARGKSDQLGGAFSNLKSTVYTLTQGINNLGSAINNLPSNKSITIGITANTTTKGSLPAGVSMNSIDSNDWGTITGYTGGTASTGGRGLFAGLFGGLRSGIHSGVKGLSGGLDRMSAFESLADNVIGNTSYEYYYNSKNGGDVSDSLSSGSFNCYDGSLVLMSLASLLGLDSELKGTTVGGEGHAYTKIGGKIFDSTAMQLFGRRTAPNVQYSGVSGTDNSKQKQDKPVNVTVNVNGDIYGEKDLKDKIKEGAEQVMIDLLSPSKATGR